MAVSRRDSAAEATLGEVLESLSCHPPHTIDLPVVPTAMQTYGNGVVVGLEDGKVLLVCVAPLTCYNLESASPHTGEVLCLAVSKERGLCLSGDYEGGLKLWSLTGKKELATLSGHSEYVVTVIIAPNQLGISAGWDKMIKVWDLQETCELFALKGHTEAVNCLEISANSQLLYSGDNSGAIKVWDLEKKKEIASFLGHTWGVTCLTLSPDGKLLASGSRDGDIRIWNVADKKEVSVFSDKNEASALFKVSVHQIRFLLKRPIVISASIRGLAVLDISTQPKRTDFCDTCAVLHGPEVSKSEKFCLTCRDDGATCMWDLENNEEVAAFQGNRGIAEKVQLTEDNTHFVSNYFDKTLKIWSLESRRGEKVIEGFKHLHRFLAITPDLVITNDSGDIQLWSLRDCQSIGKLQGHAGPTNALLVSPDNKTLISGDDDCAIRFWSLKTRTLEDTFRGLSEAPSNLAMTADGRLLLSATPFSLVLWSLKEKSIIGSTSTKESTKIITMLIRPNGKCAVCAHWGAGATIWSLPELQSLGKLPDYLEFVTGLAFTPDGRTLISCRYQDNFIILWDFDQRSILTTLQGHSQRVWSVDVSPNGLYMVSSSDDLTVRLWSLRDRREFACFRLNEGTCQGAYFSADGACVVSHREKALHLTPFTVPWDCADTTPIQATNEMAAIVADLISGKHVGKVASRLLIPSYGVNSLHISAFYNHSKRVQEHLAVGVPFLKGAFGSPLTVALQRKTVKCVEAFLSHLISLAKVTKDDLEWSIFVCVEGDIPLLLRCGSTLLQPFFEVLMQSPALPTLPYFITPKWDLPIVIQSDNRLLQILEFDVSQKGQIGSELVRFNVSLIRQNLTPGSAESLELVEALQDCEDRTVLKTPFISTIIEQKWAYFYPLTLSFTLLYAAMLTSLVMLLFNVWETAWLASFFIAINGFFILYEMAQMVVDKWAYWQDPWNYVDIIRVVLSLFWGALILLGQEPLVLSGYQREVRLWLALLCLLRGFTYFRSFRATRLFVHMTLAVIKEMYSFLFIMTYSVFAFGVCTSVLLRHDTLGESWTAAFSLVLGDFDSKDFFFLEWLIFSCAAIVNVIIMLNLLVSILGDAYEMTQMSVRENDFYLMLELVNEYESLMFWRRSEKAFMVVFTCDRALESESSSDWAGQVSKITDKMKEEVAKSTELIQGHLQAATETIEDKMVAQNSELKKVQAQLMEAQHLMEAQNSESKKMQAQLLEAQHTMEEKLQAILVLLKDRS